MIAVNANVDMRREATRMAGVPFAKNIVGDNMKKKKLSKVIRIRLKTEKLLRSFNTPTIDDAIIKMWVKITILGKECNSWKKESACRTPKELRILLDKIYGEINKLKEEIKADAGGNSQNK